MSAIEKMGKVPLFLENAAKAAAGVYQIKNQEDLAAMISELVSKGTAVFCSRSAKLEKSVTARLSNLVSEYSLASVTIEQVSAAIAETGSIVSDSTGGRAVQASLIPSHHVAIVPSKKIFSTLDDFFEKLAAEPPTNITLITGPSRTADIELEIEIGVHGPERLDIIVVGD